MERKQREILLFYVDVLGDKTNNKNKNTKIQKARKLLFFVMHTYYFKSVLLCQSFVKNQKKAGKNKQTNKKEGKKLKKTEILLFVINVSGNKTQKKIIKKGKLTEQICFFFYHAHVFLSFFVRFCQRRKEIKENICISLSRFHEIKQKQTAFLRYASR